MTTYKSQINPSQVANHPSGLKNEYVVIPSQSAPSFGSQFSILLNQTNVFLHDIVLDFNVGAVATTTTGGTFISNTPRLSPAPFWIQKVEIRMGSSVIETLYDLDIFEHVQLWSEDEKNRIFLNDAMGLYSSAVDRYTLSNTTSDWYVPLKCFVNSTHIPILSLGHQITLNVYMSPLANVLTTDLSGGTITSTSCNINSCAAICRLTRMTPELANASNTMLMKSPTTYLFSDVKYQSFVAQSGITQFTGILANITGKVQALYFVVRNTATGLVGDNAFQFTPISQFEIRDSGSTNIVGGSPIRSTFNQAIQSAAWLRTFYLNDSYTGVSNSYVYVYSFAISPLEDINVGRSSGGSRVFSGVESLLLTFPSALTQSYQIDCFAYLASGVCLTASTATKVNVP